MSEPIRTCVVCRTRAVQSALVRVGYAEGIAVVSRTMYGRGAWVHEKCQGRLTTKTLSRALRHPVTNVPVLNGESETKG